MKKFAILSVAALALVCMSQQQASAWFNIGLKAGVAFNWQSGNNSYFRGAYVSGPANCPVGMYPGVGGPVGFGVRGPIVYPYINNGHISTGDNHAVGTQNTAPKNAASQSTSVTPSSVYQAYYQTGYYGYGYQPVNYSYPGYGYGYQAPAANPYYYQAPSYWYGR